VVVEIKLQLLLPGRLATALSTCDPPDTITDTDGGDNANDGVTSSNQRDCYGTGKYSWSIGVERKGVTLTDKIART
jgi:hypothetical protein